MRKASFSFGDDNCMAAPIDVQSFAPLVAVLGGMGAFLKLIFSHLDNESTRHDAEMKMLREDHRTDMEQQRTEFTTFLGNHMSGNTNAMKRVADQLNELTREIREDRKR